MSESNLQVNLISRNSFLKSHLANRGPEGMGVDFSAVLLLLGRGWWIDHPPPPHNKRTMEKSTPVPEGFSNRVLLDSGCSAHWSFKWFDLSNAIEEAVFSLTSFSLLLCYSHWYAPPGIWDWQTTEFPNSCSGKHVICTWWSVQSLLSASISVNCVKRTS